MVFDDDTYRGRTNRSPSYPAIDLEEAVVRAGLLYKQNMVHPTRVGSAMQILGYSPKSGPGTSVLAALIKFGLLEDEGRGDERKVRVTETGRRIILRSPDSDERRHLIREAALLPTIHQDLWERYGASLPSDALLRDYLVVERRFNEGVVGDFLKQYRSTLRYAGLLDEGSDSPENAPDSDSDDSTMSLASRRDSEISSPPVPLRARAHLREFAVPLSPAREAVLQVPTEMSESDWLLLMAVLTAMKPGIVTSGASSPRGTDVEFDPGE